MPPGFYRPTIGNSSAPTAGRGRARRPARRS